VPDISRLVIEIDSAGVLTANGNLEVFSRLGHKAGQASDDMSKKFGAFMLIVNKLPGPLRSIASGLMGIVTPAQAAVSLFLELGEAAVNFAKESIQAFADFEMIKANLEVVMGSAQQAAASFDEIRKMAGRTPFNVEQLASAAVQLKQTGTAANDLIPVLTMLGNTAGGSSDKFNRIVENFAQVQSVGKTTAMDLRQFAMMGIPIYDMLRQMGIEGNATAEQIFEAFRRMTAEGGAFYNAMEKGAGTLQGKITNLEGTWKTFQATLAETTGIAEWWKKIIDERTETIDRNTESLIANKNARDAQNAIKSGEDTDQNRYEQYANELIVIDNQIRDFENQSENHRGTELVQLDILYKKRKGILDLLEPYKIIENERLAREKTISTELERQNKLIEDQKKIYDDIMAGINDRYSSTTQGRIETLQQSIANNEKLLTNGLARQVPNLFSQQTYGPNLPGVDGNTTTVSGLTQNERRRIEIINNAEKKQLEELLKTLDVEILKDWQIELGKIFNFTPTAETRGLPVVTKYIDDLTAARDKLFSGYGNRTIADILGISELDQAKADIADIQGNLRQMLEFRGSEQWTGDDTSIQRLIDELNQAQARYENVQYDEYLANLNQEYELLGKSNEEREKAVFLDQMKQAGITDRDYTESLWEAKKRNDEATRLKEDRDDYEKYLADLDKELNLVGLSTREREKQQLLEEKRFLNEENILSVLEKQRSILASQNSYNTIRSILGTDESGYSANFEAYLTQIDERLEKINNFRSPSEYPIPIEETELDTGEIIFRDRAEEFKKYVDAMGLDITQLYRDVEQEMRNAIIALYEAGESDGIDFDNMINRYISVKSIADGSKKSKEIEAVLNSFNRTNAGAGNLIADTLGLSELDRAKSELADIERDLRRIAEYKGTADWTVYEETFNKLKNDYNDTSATIKGLTFDKYLSDLTREHDLLGMGKEERKRETFFDQMNQAGITDQGRLNKLWDKRQKNDYDKNYTNLKEELDIREELLDLTKEEARIKELADQTGSETRARELYDREQNISAREIIKDLEAEIDLKRQSLWLSEEEARVLELIAQGYDKEMAVKQAGAEQTDRELDAIKNSIDMLKEAGISLAASSLIDFAHDLGNAFRDGTASSEAFSEATKNMLRSLVDAMPQLLLNVGLQLISAGQWPAGLGFIAASGLMSFISGLMPEAEKDKNNDEYEKLNQIRQQITDLISAQKEQEEYYTVKKRQLTAQSSISVNDAIITPRGIVNTHPEDFIIATKHPETLMSGGSAPVNITIINNTPDTVTQQEGVDEDGARQITVLIDQVVQNGLASGKYDRAIGTMNQRAVGRHVVS
jgi:hypothetical protein